MDQNNKEIFKTLNPNKVWIPILFGLAIVFYLFYSDPDVTVDNLSLIFDAKWWPVTIAVLLILARAAGYIYRIRVIADKQLSLTSCVYVIMLWEFASAVTPSVVGGTAVAVFILMKEGINLGKSTAYVMLTAILDNLFFVVAAPLAILLAPGIVFPGVSEQLSFFGKDFSSQDGLQLLFIISYFLIAVYTLIMAYALFLRPRAFKWLLLKVTSIRFLRKWRFKAYEHGNEIVWASSQIRGKKVSYWTKIILATIFIWVVRYGQLNALVGAFESINFSEHIVIFARQIVLWIIMLISPTPGSSGTAEFFFSPFFEEFLGQYTFVTNIFWRLLSYYPYLILGAIFLPRWIRRVFFVKKEEES